MNYEKKYKEALERAKDLHDNHALGMPFIYKTCEDIFPELKKSEDEKTRKQILNFLKEFENDHYINLDFSSWIAWLEKQSPIEQDTEIRDLWVYIREWNDKFGRLPKDEDELATCIDYVMKRQKPEYWKPSEEQLIALKNVIIGKRGPLYDLYFDLKKL